MYVTMNEVHVSGNETIKWKCVCNVSVLIKPLVLFISELKQAIRLKMWQNLWP